MTREELSQFDGQEGRRAYVAVNKTIYDVTDSPLWANGFHKPDHRAGGDLTAELSSAPHVRAVVERFPVVGKLEEEAPATTQKGAGKIIAALVIVIIIVIIGLVVIL
jgi:predicted heme/steroid binding protein